MKARTAILLLLPAALLAAGAGVATYGSAFTAFSQIVVGPPAPTTIAAVSTLEGYGVALRWEAPASADITGFRIERYRFEDGTWSPATTITINNPDARTYVDMCGMGRWAYRVQSIKSE